MKCCLRDIPKWNQPKLKFGRSIHSATPFIYPSGAALARAMAEHDKFLETQIIGKEGNVPILEHRIQHLLSLVAVPSNGA